ncbi:MAG: pilus assembly protein [Emcibacteraceae bacterium]|nr:pilus assembly protein [Emcibacteraceae bacterium]
MKNTKHTFINLLQKIKANQKGAFVVEYALLLPVFVTMIFGSMEVGRILMVYSALEGAVTESTRIAITGNIPEGYATTDAYIKDYVKETLENVGIDAGVTISMKVYDSFSDIGAQEPFSDTDGDLTCNNGEFYTDVNNNGTWDTDMGANGTGGEENIMVMEIAVELPYMMHGLIGAFSEEEHINLVTSTAVRNEPYGGIAWEPTSTVRTCGV